MSADWSTSGRDGAGLSEAERECLAELASTRALVSDRARVAEVRDALDAGVAPMPVARPVTAPPTSRRAAHDPDPRARAASAVAPPSSLGSLRASRDAARHQRRRPGTAAAPRRSVAWSDDLPSDPSDPSDGSRDRPEFSFASPSRPRERAYPLASESGRESGAFASSREEPERSAGVAPRAGPSVVPNAARRGLSFGPERLGATTASKNPPSGAASDPWRSSLRGGFVRGTTPRSSLSRHLSRRRRPSSSGAARRLSADELGFLAALADERALVSTRASLAAERAVRGEASDPIAAQPAPPRVSWSADAAPANHHASPPAMMRGRGGAGAVVRSSWNPSPAKKTSGSSSSRGSPLARRKTPYSLSSRGESPADAAERMSREHSRRMWRSLPEAFDATEENARALSSRRDGDAGPTLSSGGGGGAEDPASRSSFRSPARPAPPPSVLRRSAPPRSDGGDDFGVGDDLLRTGSPRTGARFSRGRGVSIAGVVGGARVRPAARRDEAEWEWQGPWQLEWQRDIERADRERARDREEKNVSKSDDDAGVTKEAKETTPAFSAEEASTGGDSFSRGPAAAAEKAAAEKAAAAAAPNWTGDFGSETSSPALTLSPSPARERRGDAVEVLELVDLEEEEEEEDENDDAEDFERAAAPASDPPSRDDRSADRSAEAASSIETTAPAYGRRSNAASRAARDASDASRAAAAGGFPAAAPLHGRRAAAGAAPTPVSPAAPARGGGGSYRERRERMKEAKAKAGVDQPGG